MKKWALLVLFAACASEPSEPPGVDVLSDSTLSFTLALTTLQRSPQICGDPSADLFQLELSGAPASDGFATTIGINFHLTLPLQQSLPVNLGDFNDWGAAGYTQTGLLPLENNGFSWAGRDPRELEKGPLWTVDVRIDKLPEVDGDFGTLTIRMQYTDGKVFDVQISVPSHTLMGCPIP